MRSVFMCDFCSYIGEMKDVIAHEKMCYNNPEVKCCGNCKYGLRNGLQAEWGGIVKNTQPFYCIYDEVQLNKMANMSCSCKKPVDINGCCEHYERGTPIKVVAV